MASETHKISMRRFYEEHKEQLIQQITSRKQLTMNRDRYVEDNRDKIITELNNGKRKFMQTRTLDKFDIKIEPNTLKYYHNISPEATITQYFKMAKTK